MTAPAAMPHACQSSRFASFPDALRFPESAAMSRVYLRILRVIVAFCLVWRVVRGPATYELRLLVYLLAGGMCLALFRKLATLPVVDGIYLGYVEFGPVLHSVSVII